MDSNELLECVNNALAIAGIYIAPALTNNDVERICKELNTEDVGSIISEVLKQYRNDLEYLLFA